MKNKKDFDVVKMISENNFIKLNWLEKGYLCQSKSIFYAIFITLFLSMCVSKSKHAKVVNLKCEYRCNPLGIDEAKPRLSWIISSDQRAEKQEAYQIIVSSSEELLSQDQGDLWNSGKMISDQSILVEYAGKPLESRMYCYWKVRVWDKDGNPTGWSDQAYWSMGLLKKEDWQAQWIGSIDSTMSHSKDLLPKKTKDATSLPARMLRHEFSLDKQVKKATVYVCGLGFFELYLNGQKVEDHFMDPGLTDYNKVALYLTFDVTSYLKKDKNCIGAILGNGRYFAPRKAVPVACSFYGLPQLLLQLEIESVDGSKLTVIGNEDWKITTEGPILENNEYDGEVYDARMELKGWDSTGFDDSSWKKVHVMDGPKGILASQMLEPMRITEIIKPIRVSKFRDGIYIVDMGQNFYGTLQVKVSGSSGTKVEMESAYGLKKDGSLKTEDNRTALSTDIYILNGKGIETWSPRFRGQGYRRIKVSGFPGVPTVDNFAGLVIHTDVKQTGKFECSDNLINHIHNNMRWGMRAFLRSAPLDPDRDERQAWMGDPAKDAESEGFNFNVSPFYTKWMHDVRLSQRADSTIPDVSMYWTFGNGIEWQSVFTIIPEWIQNYYADNRVIQTNYDAMKKWVLSMERHSLADHTSKATSYGDWCDTYCMDNTGADGKTSHALISTAYHYNDCRIMCRAAKRLGKSEDERLFSELAEKIKEGFTSRFFRADTGTFESETQCSYILPLAFDLVPQQYKSKVINNLREDILRQSNGHLSVGLIGAQWIMQVLSDNGCSDVAWTIVNQTTRPSWGYMIKQGATTIWERWDYDTQGPGMNSEALLILAGNLDAWFYQTLAGINYDNDNPGFKHIIMKPTLIDSLKWVKASYESMYGNISSDWNYKDQQFRWNITVPANTYATIYIPAESKDSVIENGKTASQSEGVEFLKMDSGKAIFNIVSGNYSFISKIKNAQTKIKNYVSTPVINPRDYSVAFPGKIKVKITCPAADAEIHYTLDGSIPTVQSPVFKAVLDIEKSTDVMAMACKQGFESSSVCFSSFDFYNPSVNGWNYSYYEGTWTKLPDFSKLHPVKKGKTTSTDPNNFKWHDLNFAIEFEAFIQISKEDVYTFYTSSDDGSKLIIDEKTVVDNDGIHGVIENTGKIKLTIGKHNIKVDYFQGLGGKSLNIAYRTKVKPKKQIPLSILYYESVQ